jgi:uncharacterized protein
MSAAWLLSQRHRVTVYERERRLGGHSNTAIVPTPAGEIAVDTGFIVYNAVNYPNLVALFEALKVPTLASDMSLAVSLDDGALEYGGSNLPVLFAQSRNLVRPRFWAMLRGIQRFSREAPALLRGPDDPELTLGEYLDAAGYSRHFVEGHLLPMAAAIWSAPPAAMLNHPAVAFVRFLETHGLLRLRGRPKWRTVAGGSREYVRRLTAAYADRVRLSDPVRAVRRVPNGVSITGRDGSTSRYDHVVIATHADEALAMLEDASPEESGILGAFRYQRNHAVLHSDPALMPRRRRIWASWNYLGGRGTHERPAVTYWMNRLQQLPDSTPLFVTLNPGMSPRRDTILRSLVYDHPVYSVAALRAQRDLWRLQGTRRTWYCGAYFGAGFHEDGLQSGLWVAEALGGLRRPWNVPAESGRIFLPTGRLYDEAREEIS